MKKKMKLKIRNDDIDEFEDEINDDEVKISFSFFKKNLNMYQFTPTTAY